MRVWAWNLASSAAVWQQRDLGRFYERFRLLATSEWAGLSDLPNGTEPRTSSPATTPTRQIPSFDPDRCADVADAVEGLTRPDRQDLHLRAEALLTGLGLPPIRRISCLVDRQRIHQQLAGDELLASGSLAAWLAAASEPAEPRAGAPLLRGPEQPEFEPALTAIWDQFSVERATRLLTCGGTRQWREILDHTVAMAAVAPLPRPAPKTIRSFVSAVVAASGRRHEAIRDVAAAFVEVECEPVARRATTPHDLSAIMERHQRLKAAFVAQLRQVAGLDSALGGDPMAVRRHLYRLAQHEGLLFSSPLEAGLRTITVTGADGASDRSIRQTRSRQHR